LAQDLYLNASFQLSSFCFHTGRCIFNHFQWIITFSINSYEIETVAEEEEAEEELTFALCSF
jgi:hypothetical protein